MITNSIIRNLLSDSISLNEYLCCKAPSFNDIERRLLLLLRDEDKNLPDHYYRLNINFFLGKEGIDSIPKLLTKGLYNLADEHLEINNNRIYVRQEMQSSWQELVTYIPPLILQMAFLQTKRPLCINSSFKEIREYCKKYILPNVRFTALPYPYIPEIKHLVDKNNGFHDLHIHLNGSTETDIVWQELLLHPQKVRKLYNESVNKNCLALEQMEQDFAPMNAMKLEQLLLSARRIRQYLFDVIFNDIDCKDENNIFNLNNLDDIIYKFIYGHDALNGVDNPFVTLVNNEGCNYVTSLNIEGLMYVLVFSYLIAHPKNNVANAFHFYLLILGLFNRLLVQQKHDYGFEEFQKHTLNNIRYICEDVDYKTRFLQLQGNKGRNITFVEGRFSPKQSEFENANLISNIERGWKKCWNDIKCILCNEHNNDCCCMNTKCSLDNKCYFGKCCKDNDFSCHDSKQIPIKIPELKLIAHFIKRKDDGTTIIRHENLRKDIWEKAFILSLMKKNNLPGTKHIVGIDTAASEFDAPPEVFAPMYRYLKRNGFHHFTYHAGEDFFHLIGGLRRIYEAVDFLNLSYGDRIGHATAAGLSPEIWIENVGKYIFMYQGEYLDDLVFVYNLIVQDREETLKHKINELAIKIHELYYNIYRHSCSVELISEVWKLRRLCPIHVFAESKENAKCLSVYDNDEWCDVAMALQLNSDDSCNCDNSSASCRNDKDYKNEQIDERIELLRRYHCPNYRPKYNKIIKVNATEFFNETELEALQLLVLKFLHEKDIVIETLPTSNVRIGHHNTYDSYHLWNWVRWESENKPIPPIVVGTDDAGIFATNIYNEYVNIYCNLVYVHHINRVKALEVIEKLNKNALIYRFSSDESYDI